MANPTDSHFAEEEDQTVIWGTTINVEHVLQEFRRFLAEYRPPTCDGPLYTELLRQIVLTQSYIINIDLKVYFILFLFLIE